MENGTEQRVNWAALPLIATLARLLCRELTQGEMNGHGDCKHAPVPQAGQGWTGFPFCSRFGRSQDA